MLALGRDGISFSYQPFHLVRRSIFHRIQQSRELPIQRIYCSSIVATVSLDSRTTSALTPAIVDALCWPADGSRAIKKPSIL